MASKRLLDVAKLFNAGRSVAKQHLVLRREQWDVYTRTSSLAKAAKEQTDRVTVTARAAHELAKTFNEAGPSWQRGTSDPSDQHDYTEPEPKRSPTAAHSTRSQASVKPSSNALSHDDKYDRGKQEHDDGTLSSLRNRELQRQSEAQIPTSSASFQQHDQQANPDSFGERTYDISLQLSSLPRVKIPRHAVGTSRQASQRTDESANQDLSNAPGGHIGPKEEDLPEGVSFDGAFTSPRVSRMVGKSGPNIQNPYGRREKMPPRPLPEMQVAKEQWNKETRDSTSAAQSAALDEPSLKTANGDAETQKLAEEIAQDAGTQLTSSSDDARPQEMHESRVPSSRFGRLWQYGGLATSMAFGAVGESFRRMTGSGAEGSLMLSESNMNRLVAKLSRMRGAALKLGQMMSFQDSKMLPPAINAVLQRVQDSADYMPPSQRNKVLVNNLGDSWRDLFSNFEEKPFAAASIGQVHKATLASNGKDVAVKVQYPGVKNSIDSDLNNLSLLLTASKLLPKGLFLDKTIANARVELAWECDYGREAEACIRFSKLLAEEKDTFGVPEIYNEASGAEVLTAEFMTGTAVTKIKDLSQSDRDWVGTQILRLSLRELMEWRFMQTDPNWTNFLYNQKSKKLELLDFGASRDFPDKFVEPYVSLLIAASKGDRESCRDLSVQLGYLTGHEGKDMTKAHVDSILTLAEPFVESAPDVYDFKDQTITDRVRANIGLMLKERLAPPPEETYSLHRKLSGAFLLCARLQSKVHARDMFARAVEVWNGRHSQI